jgi:FMN phosphatase YigB (HAD superfamily)
MTEPGPVGADGIGCVVFDLDGTLYPLEEFAVDYAALLRDAVLELSSCTREDCEEMVCRLMGGGEGARGSVTAIVESAGVPILAWNNFRDSRLRRPTSIRLNSSITTAVKTLATRIPVALVTNSTTKLAHGCLSAVGLKDDDFSVLVAADSGLAPKPSTAPFLEVARLVPCEPAALFGIGDRWNMDVAPLIELGGGGICVSKPSDVVEVCAHLMESAFGED